MNTHHFPVSGWPAPCIVALILLSLGLACPTAARAQSVPTLDPSFKPVITRMGGFGSAVAVQADGKILLAGGFNAIDGLARNGLARLNSDGSVDPAFVTGAICCGINLGGALDASAAISALTLQQDGKILIGGSFTNVGGVTRRGLARLNSDGSLDGTFDPGSGLESVSFLTGLLPVVAMVVQPDGKVVVGGYFTAIDGVPRSGLARLNANGSVDTGFDPGTALAIGFPDFGPISGLALLANGQVLVAGAFQAFADVKRNGLARLNADGSLDWDFDPAVYLPGGPPSIDGLVVQPDGGIVISGVFSAVDDQSRIGLARLKPDGTVDVSFDPNAGIERVETYTVLGLQTDGKIVAYHQFTDANHEPQRVIVRLNPNGAPDPAFNLALAPGEASRLQLRGLAFQADGKVLVAGNLSAVSNPAQSGILRADATGQVENAFDPQLEVAEGEDSNVLALTVQPDGKVLLGGSFTRIDGVARTQLARLNRDGTLDLSFAPVLESDQPRSLVSALALQADGKILIGGVFSAVNGASRNAIARLNPDGSLDAAFDIGSGTREGDPSEAGFIGAVTVLAVQPDGKVLMAGDFTVFNGQSVPWLGRLNSDGTLDLGFNSGVGVCFTCDPPTIRQVRVLGNGFIMVSGIFARVDSFFIDNVVRLQEDGSIDVTFQPAATAAEQVTAMAVGPDDKATVAIAFSDPATNELHTRLARFNSDGTVDAGFTPGTVIGEGSTLAPVSALSVDAQGRLLIAGHLASIGGVPRRGLARLNPDGALDTGFDAGSGFGSGVFPPGRNLEFLIAGMALGTDGSMVVGGAFATANNQVRLGLARFQAGGADPGGGSGAALGGLVRAATGAVSMLVTGEPGASYRIEASSDLRAWTAVGTVTGAATPQPFSDPGAASVPHRFYRAVSP